MVKSNIRIFTHGQRLGTGKSVPHYAGETIHYIGAHFDLDESWEGYDSVRAVWWNGAVEKATVFDATMTCIIPLEVVAKKGYVMVNLIASVSENGVLTDRFTSYPLKVAAIDADVKLTGSETVPVTPSQFEQFVEAVQNDADRAYSEADRATDEANRAEQAAEGAEASATGAEASATDAESAKTAALEAKGAAETAAASAEQSATDAGNYAGLAEAAEQDAQAAKTAAEGSATAAAASATQAQESTTRAAQKASEASASATAASTSATNAEAAKTDAETSQAAAETAQASAEQAQASAEQSATTAAASATQAGQSASDAQTAKTDAETAQTAAEAAKDTAVANATTATTKAAEAAQSASSASDSETAAEAAATRAEQAAASLTVDNALSETSENPVQNKVVTGAVTQLKSQIDAFTEVPSTINLIDPNTIVDNSFWKLQNPETGSYSRTGLINVKPNTAYTFANTEAQYWAVGSVRAKFIAFFDKDGIYLSWQENIGTFTTPATCYKVVISFKPNARNVILIEGTYDIATQTMVYVPYVRPSSKVDGIEIDGLSIENIDDYALTGKNLFDASKAITGMFLKSYPSISEHDGSFVSDYIPVKANTSYVISHTRLSGQNASIRSYVLYDNQYQKVSGEEGDAINKIITPTVDGFLRFCGYIAQLYRTQVETGTTPTTFEPYKKVLNNEAILNDEQLAQVGNILYKKKWVVCGDSFTNSGGTGTVIPNGKYNGRPYTYPWIIGTRNDMEIVRFFEGGRTLAFPAEPGTFVNSLTCPTQDYYYQNIPTDADYITIYLGINDEHHSSSSSGGDGEDNTGIIPIGTIDDDTTATYLGAWNIVLTWLITNRPNAHIGIIVTNGIANKDQYRLGQIAIAEKYGIPYIDMNGDARTPAMLRTSNPNIPTSIKRALIAKWAVDPSSNTHPNDAAQLFESTFIEDFLRSI